MTLLPSIPKQLTRPLSLLEGHGYAAAWLWVEVTTTEVLTKQGEVEKLPAPQIEHRLERFIVRDDGWLYGELRDPLVHPLADLAIADSPARASPTQQALEPSRRTGLPPRRAARPENRVYPGD